jgi:hypothetical protein
MTKPAIDPPVLLATQPNQPIRTLDEAADVVRLYARDHRNVRAEALLHRIEGAVTKEEMETAANGFRAWAEAEGLLLLPPDGRVG